MAEQQGEHHVSPSFPPITVAILRRLDGIRPGVAVFGLMDLLNTTTGLLDLYEAFTGDDRETLAARLLNNLAIIQPLRSALGLAILAGMRIENAADKPKKVDLVLAELKAHEKNSGITCRRLMAMGMFAGLSLQDLDGLTPGETLDLYLYRRDMEDEQHGLTRLSPA